MSQYRRWYVPGGTVFLTVTTLDRRPLLATEPEVTRLRSAASRVHADWPFDFVAAVVLPDHFHFLWTLPDGDDAYSKRLGRLKSLFTQSLPANDPLRRAPTASRRTQHESGVWQRRFWEHTVRDEDDFKAHLDYIHYNPVKHGYAARPAEWPHSSFHKWVALGEYDNEWGTGPVDAARFERIASDAGE